ncbi:MAG: ABC transporter ATP-binding protein, partial [Eggerthella sp.]|nr:ABC transporter ATP-binding protein [Eggerthella sp.]
GGYPVLDDVSLRIEPGSVVHLSGRSGSGKSTLCKLLMRFWDATRGVVEVSGTDVRRANTASLRETQGYMTQETHLFAGTIGENILLAKPSASPEELAEACRKAALSGLIERLPRGLDTPVGELGETLSGGERQRIGLARVFLHDAPFVLLDEPTSNLDSLNEAAVLRALSEGRGDKTVVLVSHRASTAAIADVEYTVDRGRLG